ncbi:MAG: HNH endonuclease [Pseudomonadales bacterium]|nr:HNH endonuclease [Pseudomonadales bacterium]
MVKRLSFSLALQVKLAGQAQEACPLCNTSLFLSKHGSPQKVFEIAHIYPLNPTVHQKNVLASILPPTDLNHEHNLLPLCPTCHTNYDKNMLIEEYEELVKIKQKMIDRENQQAIAAYFPIEEDIQKIINMLYDEDSLGEESLVFEAKSIKSKLDDSMSGLTKKRIGDSVDQYFRIVREKLIVLEHSEPNQSALIAGQIRNFYTKQDSLNLSQEQIFENVIDWILSKTKSVSNRRYGAEIVASFYVQNCELFDDCTK